MPSLQPILALSTKDRMNPNNFFWLREYFGILKFLRIFGIFPHDYVIEESGKISLRDKSALEIFLKGVLCQIFTIFPGVILTVYLCSKTNFLDLLLQDMKDLNNAVKHFILG